MWSSCLVVWWSSGLVVEWFSGLAVWLSSGRGDMVFSVLWREGQLY